MAELTRLTVNLTPKSDTALTNLAERTDLNRTDLVNRALQLYDYVDKATDAGHQLLLLKPDGETVRIKLL